MAYIELSFADLFLVQMVCVCVPEQWKKTIEADAYDDGAGPGSPPS